MVCYFHSVDSDVGLGRKPLLVQAWIALLGQTLGRRDWQERSVIVIVEYVFADQESIAAWRWGDDVAQHVGNGLYGSTGGTSKSCVQYRESDIDACWPKRV